LIVAKNAGGKAAYAKIEAARQLEIKVIMIERPVISDRLTFYNPEEVVHWISVSG
jgi:precorrin-6A/cobalt-precorrin-6A reductase